MKSVTDSTTSCGVPRSKLRMNTSFAAVLSLVALTVASRSVAANYTLAFDGSNDCIAVPYVSSLDLTQQVSIEAWIRPVRFASQMMIVSRANFFSQGGNYNLMLVSNCFAFAYKPKDD